VNPLTGATFWTSTPLGTVKNAPAAVTFGSPGFDFVVAGATAGTAIQNGPRADLVVLNGDTGAVTGSFLAQETFTGGQGTISDIEGSVMSSPTDIVAATSLSGAAPAVNGVVFGVDALDGVFTQSNGRLYAVRPDGTVAWETLLAGAIHGSPLFVGQSSATDNPDGFIYVGTQANTAWAGRPGSNDTSASGRFYQLDALTGRVLAEVYLGTGSQTAVDGSALLIPGTGGSTGSTAHILFADRSDVRAVSQAVTAPPAGVESPSLTAVWTNQIGLVLPTSPALSVSGTTIYLGDNQGLVALSAATGATLWSDALGPILGSPAVVLLAGTVSTSQVVVGTQGAPPGVFGVTDTGSAGVTAWQLLDPKDATGQDSAFGLSSPAIGPVSPPFGNAEVFIGSTHGGFFTIA
jgi:hypothetical protein